MKALRINDYGASPAFEEVDTPSIAHDQVLVRVAAAALNPLDAKMQAGLMREFFPVDFPYVPGTDLSGTIVSVGSKVDGWRPGDRIVARLDPSAGGACAELCAVPAHLLVRAPTSLPLIDAAGFVTTAATAWQALFEAGGLTEGQRVLVHGGAGGVGSMAVQLAKQAGAWVVATASSANIDNVRGYGADEVIDYRADRFEEHVHDVDLVIDTIGGDVETRSLDTIRPGGTLIALPMPPDVDRAERLGINAIFVAHASDADRLARVAERIDHGLKLRIDSRVRLADGAEALAVLADGGAQGKVLLVPDSDRARG